MKFQIEGQSSQVYPFLYNLQQRSQIELIAQESQSRDSKEGEMISVTCFIRFHPSHSIRIVQLTTVEGTEIQIPMLNLIAVEIEEGVKVLAGRVHDVFA